MPLKPKFQKMLSEMINEHGKEKGTSIFWAKIKKEEINPEQKAYFIYGTELKHIGDDIVEGYIATGEQDLVNDVITPACMVDMLAQLKNRVIKIDVEHESLRGKSKMETEVNKTIIPVSKITESVLDTRGVKVKTKLNSYHSRYGEVKGSIDDGFLDAFSIAFFPIEVSYEMKDGKKIRHLEKVNLLNVAYTGNPINPGAGFTDIMLKAMNDSFGGLNMKDSEKKSSEVVEPDKVDAPAEDDKGGESTDPKPEANAEAKALEGEVKALKKEIADLKAKAEKKDEEGEGTKKDTPKVEERVEALEAKAIVLEKALSAPIVKGRAGDAADAEAAVVEEKSKGPLDKIR